MRSDYSFFRKLLPLACTSVRFFLAPFLAVSLSVGNDIISLALLCAAALSDFFDGYFARRFDACTPLGAALDPLADKMVITAGFGALALKGLVPWGAVACIVGRDLIVTFLRSRQSASRRPLVTSFLAKSKTALQFILLSAYPALSFLEFSCFEPALSSIGVGVVCGLTLWSGVAYLFAGASQAHQESVALFCATVGGVGFLPGMPGTWGSIVGLVCGLALSQLPLWLALTLFIVWWGFTSTVLSYLFPASSDVDPAEVVADEACAMATLAYLLPGTILVQSGAFLLFRFFDITKPGLIARAEGQGGSTGILLDDLLAACCAGLIVSALLVVLPLFSR